MLKKIVDTNIRNWSKMSKGISDPIRTNNTKHSKVRLKIKGDIYRCLVQLKLRRFVIQTFLYNIREIKKQTRTVRVGDTSIKIRHCFIDFILRTFTIDDFITNG
jgi:hypothetical protein